MTIDELQALLDPAKRQDARLNKITARLGTDAYLKPVPVIKCKDGFELSVQAGSFLYCCPRDSVGPYSAAEVGFPTEKVEEFMPFCEDHERPTDTVYGWVPLEIIAKVISDHGGIIEQTETKQKG